MLISFATRFAILSSIFRSRAALELENAELGLTLGTHKNTLSSLARFASTLARLASAFRDSGG
jgi:hypothetical protein